MFTMLKSQSYYKKLADKFLDLINLRPVEVELKYFPRRQNMLADNFFD